MENNATNNRGDVKIFFEFSDLGNTWDVGKIFLWAGGITALVVFIATQGVFVLAIIFGGALGYFAMKWAERENLKSEKKQEEKFSELARHTRSIQASDSIKAFLRIFDRSQLTLDELRVFDQKYIFEKERDLFSEIGIAEKLADLFNKSIRLYSRADFNNKRIRKVRWKETKRVETFYNPMRVVAIFLTDTELLICDSQIDSIDGDLKESILRVMLSDIVSIGFTSERVRLPLTKEAAVRMAKDLGTEEVEIKAIEQSFSGGNAETKQDASGFVLEEMKSSLEISRTDSKALSFPIRSEITFGRHVSALDQESSLTEDELVVDRMVNELNRVVRGSRARA